MYDEILADNNNFAIRVAIRSFKPTEEASSDGTRSALDKEVSSELTPAMDLSGLASQHVNKHSSPTMRSSPDLHDDSDDENSDDEEYHSFESSDSEAENGESGTRTDDEKRKEHAARELERQRVLEAAGLLVKSASTETVEDGPAPPPRPVRRRSTRRRRAPPEAPNRLSVASLPSLPSDKDLPATPNSVLHIDDAFERYEAYRHSQDYRLSLSSIDTGPPSPGLPPSLSTSPSKETASENRSHSYIFKFLTRSKTPDIEPERPRLQISAPIPSTRSTMESPNTETSTAFGSVSFVGPLLLSTLSNAMYKSWASLLDKDALEGIPPAERKRQEVGG